MSEKNFRKNKIDKKVTWFGFTLTQQQAVILFTLALIGIIFISMLLVSHVYTLINYLNVFFTFGNDLNALSLFQGAFTIILMITAMCIFLVICIYTIIRSRKFRDISQ